MDNKQQFWLHAYENINPENLPIWPRATEQQVSPRSVLSVDAGS